MKNNMDALDTFRYSWQEELHSKIKTEQQDPSIVGNSIPYTPNGDLCRLNPFKRSFECQTISTPSVDTHSFTIGIGSFHVSSSRMPPTIVPQSSIKKAKISLTMIDELIRDIDECTDIPFFNMSLPREIALKIFDYLSLIDLCSCSQVCHSWHSLTCDELLWFNLFSRMKLRSNDQKSNWKIRTQHAILADRQLRTNWKNRQCQTKQLTNRLGIVLTCATNNRTTIVGGYSSGLIRTWSIESILKENHDEDNEEQSEIIYESTDIENLSSIKSVGLMKNDIYAIHDDGLVEIWMKDEGCKPRYTKQLTTTSTIEQVTNDERILCATNRSHLYVLNLNGSAESEPDLQQVNFLNESILFQCISSQHSVPISIVTTDKSLWCISLSNLNDRLSFYSLLCQTDSSSIYRTIPCCDIHNEEPLAIIGIGSQLKLFDLQHGRCNIISTCYENLPASVCRIRAEQCPPYEFVVALNNYQLSIFDRRQSQNAVQHFYGHFAPITTLQMDTWRVASTDEYGFVRLWDRRMHPQSLWHMHPQTHPITYCSFDRQTLICALTPLCKQPDMILYQDNPDAWSGHINVCNFQSDVSTRLDADLNICTSTYDVPQASNRRIGLNTPYDIIE